MTSAERAEAWAEKYSHLHGPTILMMKGSVMALLDAHAAEATAVLRHCGRGPQDDPCTACLECQWRVIRTLGQLVETRERTIARTWNAAFGAACRRCAAGSIPVSTLLGLAHPRQDEPIEDTVVVGVVKVKDAPPKSTLWWPCRAAKLRARAAEEGVL